MGYLPIGLKSQSPLLISSRCRLDQAILPIKSIRIKRVESCVDKGCFGCFIVILITSMLLALVLNYTVS